jgi:TorA maturation chaperone TorD
MNPDLPLDQAHESSDGAGASIFGLDDAGLDDIDQARADEYALLALLLLKPPDSGFLTRLSRLPDSNDTLLGRAHAALGQAAACARADIVTREYFDLFIGIGRGELLPYASYYLTGFLNERPLARLREDMMRLGIERTARHFDPEDHLATLCEIMSGFASNYFEVTSGEKQAFFERHIAPWAGRFFADLESAKAAKFYRSVGTLGRTFMEIETEAFAMETRRSA